MFSFREAKAFAAVAFGVLALGLGTASQAEAQAPGAGARGMAGASYGGRLLGLDLRLRLDDRFVVGAGLGAGGVGLGGFGGTGIAGQELGVNVGIEVVLAGQAFRGLWLRVETTAVTGRRTALDAQAPPDPLYASLLGSILVGTTWTLPSGFAASAGVGATRGRTLAGGRERITLDVTLRLTLGVTF